MDCHCTVECLSCRSCCFLVGSEGGDGRGILVMQCQQRVLWDDDA